MQHSTLSSPSVDRTLLFGILAVQMGFISRDALIAALNTWGLNKAKTLGQILVEQGTLGDDAHPLLEALVEKHLELHGNDAKQSFAALASARSVGEDLRQIADPELQARLAHVIRSRADGEDANSMQVRCVRWLRRHQRLVAPATATLAVALVGLIMARVASYERDRTIAGLAQQQGYAADMVVAQRAWEVSDVARVLDLLEAQRSKQSSDKDLRGWEWYYQERLCHEELRTLLGHTLAVLSVAFSPDGTRLATVGQDMMVKLWDAASGQELHTFEGHVGTSVGFPISAVFSPDGKRLAMTCSDGTLKLWEVATGHELLTLERGTRSVAFSPHGKWLAAIADDGVRLWDAESGQVLRTLKKNIKQPDFRTGGVYIPGYGISGFVFSSDETRLAIARGDEMELWDPASGQMLRTLNGAGDGQAQQRIAAGGRIIMRRVGFSGISSLAFSQDGTRLATTSWDRMVKLWDPASGEELRTLEGAGESVIFSPDGRRLATVSGDDIKLWDTASGQPLRTFKGNASKYIPSIRRVAFSNDGTRLVAFSNDGTRLAAASGDGMVKIWDTASGQELRTFKGHTGTVHSLAFSPDGTRLASASEDKTAKLWDVVSEPELRVQWQRDGLTCWALSPDGTRLALAERDGARLAPSGRDGTLRIWDAASGHVLRSFQGAAGGAQALAFSRDGTHLASGGFDQSVTVWDIASGKALRTLQGKTGVIHSIAFSLDGTYVAAAAGYAVKLWDAATGNELQILRHITDVNDIAFRPDGVLLASASSDRMVRVWDVASGLKLLTLPGHTDLVSSVAFSPDGSLLASASWDHTVKLWDVARGQEVHTLKGHVGRIGSVAFCPGGTRPRLASADDKEVIVWDASTGREVRTFNMHTDNSHSVAFSQDGWRLASGSADGTVIVWDAAPLSPEAQVEREASSLVRFLFRERLAKKQAMESLGTNNTLSRPVREKALALVEAHGDSQDHELAFRLVNELFARPLIKPEVIESIRKKGTLTEEVREKALVLAENWQEDLFPIIRASWAVVAKPGGDVAAYRFALARAEYACRQAPQIDAFYDTLAVAQYRVGQYQQALETLSRFDQVIMTPAFAGSQPTDLAFRAMALHRLGRKEPAQETLARLRKMMKEPQWVNDKEARGFLREAEELLKAPAGKPDK